MLGGFIGQLLLSCCQDIRFHIIQGVRFCEMLKVRNYRILHRDLVCLRSGFSIPVVGEMEDGESAIDKSMIVNELRPVRKYSGGRVVGGSINSDSSLRISVTTTGD